MSEQISDILQRMSSPLLQRQAARIAELEAENKALREALEKIRGIRKVQDHSPSFCGHFDAIDEAIDSALKADTK